MSGFLFALASPKLSSFFAIFLFFIVISTDHKMGFGHWLFLVAVAAFVMRRLLRRRRAVQGLCAVVTGASSGIGREISMLLAGKGCKLVLIGRNKERLEEVANSCRTKSPHVLAIPCDLTNPTDCDVLRRTMNENPEFLAVDLLVLNAGQGALAEFTDSPVTMTICEQLMQVNYFANVRLIQLFLAQLLRSKGRILVISSLAGILPSPLRTAYTASKHALQGFCNALRTELEPQGVNITVCCPGFVDTSFHERVLTNSGNAPDRARASFLTAKECAKNCITAVEDGTTECVLSWSGAIAYRLRPFFPAFIDHSATKHANATLNSRR